MEAPSLGPCYIARSVIMQWLSKQAQRIKYLEERNRQLEAQNADLKQRLNGMIDKFCPWEKQGYQPFPWKRQMVDTVDAPLIPCDCPICNMEHDTTADK